MVSVTSIIENNLIKLAIGNLASAITMGGRVFENEGDSLYSIFDSINRTVDQAHCLGFLIVSEGGGILLLE